MVTIQATLDLGEADDLFELIHKQVMLHAIVKKLEYLAGEITPDQYDWHVGHAEYWKGIFKKVTGQEWKIS